MDKIIFQGMEFYAYHGVYEEENKLGQSYIVDLEVYMDLRQAGQSDRLEDTLDYAQLYEIIQKFMAEETVQLIETVAEQIAARILTSFPAIEQVMVRVTKPSPPIPGHYRGVAVEINRRRPHPSAETSP